MDQHRSEMQAMRMHPDLDVPRDPGAPRARRQRGAAAAPDTPLGGRLAGLERAGGMPTEGAPTTEMPTGAMNGGDAMNGGPDGGMDGGTNGGAGAAGTE